MRRLLLPRTLLMTVTLGAPVPGCRGAEDGPGPPGTGRSAAVVDSMLPAKESLRRFRAGLKVVTALENSERTREEIVERFVRAVASSDTSELRAMVMSRAEFAYLYYPTSPHAREPTRQSPDVVWFLHLQTSQKGITRLLARYGGRPLNLRGYTCTAAPRMEGGNTVWDDCQVRLGDEPDAGAVRVFGGIIARAGRFKLFSYANDF